MSYLAHYAARHPALGGRGRRGARVDERTRLNLPGFYGDAFVRVFVEDTSGRALGFRRKAPAPRVRLRIADCVNEIALEFCVDSPQARENSLYKIHTLIGALERFRDGLEAEAQLAAERERELAGRS